MNASNPMPSPAVRAMTREEFKEIRAAKLRFAEMEMAATERAGMRAAKRRFFILFVTLAALVAAAVHFHALT